MSWRIAIGIAIVASSLASMSPAVAASTEVPGAPTLPHDMHANGLLAVGATAPPDNGSPITSYTAGCSGGGKLTLSTAARLPVTVPGLINGVHYTCRVHANSPSGPGLPSAQVFGIPTQRLTPTMVTYCSPGGMPLRMDIYKPSGPGPFPTVMFVHGGGWTGGTRDVSTLELPRLLTDAGYALVSVDYRLAPQYKSPVQIQDVACAVRSLRANGAAWGLNTTRIGGIGWSAGGHLISLLGTAPRGEFDTGEYLGYSSRLDAVDDSFGVAEFGQADIGSINGILQNVFGTTDFTALRQWAALTYVSPDDPPFLLLHGVDDATVTIKESRDFHAALTSAHVPNQLIEVQHVGHTFMPSGTANPVPSMDAVYTATVTFFDRYLK